MAKVPGAEKRGPNTYRTYFEVGGQRVTFTAPTERAAKTEVSRLKEQAKSERAVMTVGASGITMHGALDLFLAEKYDPELDGETYKWTLTTVTTLKRWFNPNFRVVDFGPETLNRLVLERQKDCVRKRVNGVSTVVPVSPATVNRTTTEFLRRVFSHLKKSRKFRYPNMPEWADHKLEEMGDVIREVTDKVYSDLTWKIRDDYREVLDFSLMTGMRQMNAVMLRRTQVTFDRDAEGNVTGGRATLLVKSKGRQKKEKTSWLSMSACEILLRQQHADGSFFHPEFFFTYTAKRTRDGNIRGQRQPLTRNGFQSWWHQHKARTGVSTRWHDQRHTLATRILEETGDITLVQKQLGHSDIATSMKYVRAAKGKAQEAVDKVAAASVWGRKREAA